MAIPFDSIHITNSAAFRRPCDRLVWWCGPVRYHVDINPGTGEPLTDMLNLGSHPHGTLYVRNPVAGSTTRRSANKRMVRQVITIARERGLFTEAALMRGLEAIVKVAGHVEKQRLERIRDAGPAMLAMLKLVVKAHDSRDDLRATVNAADALIEQIEGRK